MQFDKALRLLYHHLGNLDMAGCLLVKCGSDNLGLYVASHVGDFFGTFIDKKDYLVNKQDYQLDFRMIRGDRIGDLLHENSLSRSRRCNDKRTLPFSDRTEKVDHSCGDIHLLRMLRVRRILEVQLLIREKRSEGIERNTEFRFLGTQSVHCYDTDHSNESFVIARGADLTVNGISGSQTACFYHVVGNVYILRAADIAVYGISYEAISLAQHFKHAFSHQGTAGSGMQLGHLTDEVLLAAVENGIFTYAFLTGKRTEGVKREDREIGNEQLRRIRVLIQIDIRNGRLALLLHLVTFFSFLLEL